MASKNSTPKSNTPKKKVKSMREVPENEYGETKKVSSYSLTPTAIETFKNISQDLSISASELLERLARLHPVLLEQLKQELRLNNTSTEIP